MSTEVVYRHDTEAALAALTPAANEIGVITDKNRLLVGDGSKMGGHQILNALDAQNNAASYVAVAGTNTLTATLAPAIAAYAAGLMVQILAANNNTGAVTLNLNGLGAKAVKKSGGASALVANDLVAGGVYILLFDGTDFQLQTASSTAAFTNTFTSALQTITAAGTLTIAHGLGAKPFAVAAWLENATAEHSFSIGDQIPAPDADDASSSLGLIMVPDATNVVVRFGSVATTFRSLNKTTAAVVNLTNANWKLIVKAWL